MKLTDIKVESGYDFLRDMELRRLVLTFGDKQIDVHFLINGAGIDELGVADALRKLADYLAK